MFNGPDFPASLDEDTFNRWLENGRASKLGYAYLLVVWDEYESMYRAIYSAGIAEIEKYPRYRSSVGRESLVAAYDLYSESRVR